MPVTGSQRSIVLAGFSGPQQHPTLAGSVRFAGDLKRSTLSSRSAAR